jgi:tRNA A-37 threonylcarbamoyl transferase component Bud32
MSRRRAPWWMYLAAASFISYFLLAIYNNFLGSPNAGFSASYASGRMVLSEISPNSAAERAGLQRNDRLLMVEGQPVRSLADWLAISANLESGRTYRMEIERGDQRRELRFALGTIPRSAFWTAQDWSEALTVLGMQLLALLLALLIAFSRPDDRIARLGALFLATVSVGNPGPPYGLAATIRHFPLPVSVLLWVVGISASLESPLFFVLCAVFPRPLFRGRWAWLLASLPVLCLAPPVAYYAYYVVYRPDRLTGLIADWFLRAIVLVALSSIVGGVVAIVTNYRRLEDPNERRRVRVLLAGFGVAWLPAFPLVFYLYLPSATKVLGPYIASPWSSLASVLYLAFPFSFAYAILRHRLFDIRVMIRQGLQYALARRLVLSLVPACSAVLLLDLFTHRDHTIGAVLRARGWGYLVLGGLAAVAHVKRLSWMEALDRRFFRERYDAQLLLSEVVQEVRQAGSFERVAPRVVAQIEAALHPEFAALLVRDGQENHYGVLASAPVDRAPPPLPAESKLVALVGVLGKPVEVPHSESGWLQQQLPPGETDFLCRTRLDLLVPIATASDRTQALLALGVKRSEEPYSREDQDLLVAIAASLALLIEKPVTRVVATHSKEFFEECRECGTCYDPGTGRCDRDSAVLTPIFLPRLLGDRYRVERCLGRGGMGTVYEAEDVVLERRVAAKVIRDDLVGSSEAAQRFRRECRATASFAHPNVVTVHDFGVVAETRAFLIMELLDGTSLREELRRKGSLPPARVQEILGGVTSAVEAAHRRQLIHRDLKPENIFLARGEAGEVPKVLDFGVAKLLPTDTQVTRDIDTIAGLLVGTPRYMSPEQLRGEPPDPMWDIWALAIVAYEMLTGAYPFPEATPAEFYRAVFLGRFTPVSAYLPGSQARWQQFFECAFASEPQRRFTSAAIFFSGLAQALTLVNPAEKK